MVHSASGRASEEGQTRKGFRMAGLVVPLPESRDACRFAQPTVGLELLGRPQAHPYNAAEGPGEQQPAGKGHLCPVGHRRCSRGGGPMGSLRSVTSRGPWFPALRGLGKGYRQTQASGLLRCRSPTAGAGPLDVPTAPVMSPTNLHLKLEEPLPLAMSLQRPLLRKPYVVLRSSGDKFRASEHVC